MVASFFLHFPLFLHRKLATRESWSTKNVLEVLIHLFVYRDHSTPPLLCSKNDILAAGRWRSSIVTSLSLRSAIVVLTQSLTPAPNLRGCLAWFQESHGQLCVWNKEHVGEIFLLRSDWSLCAASVLTTLRSRSVSSDLPSRHIT